MQLVIVVHKYLAEDLRGQFIAQKELDLFHTKAASEDVAPDFAILIHNC